MNDDIYRELCAILHASLTDTLGWMASRGQSVILNYGEDNRQWECSWITGGRRFTAVRGEATDAVRDVIGQVRADYLMRTDTEVTNGPE